MVDFKEAISLLMDKFEAWIQGFILLLPNLLIAAGILILANKISKILRNIVKKLLSRLITNTALINFLGILTQVGALLLGFLVSIKVLQLDEAVFSVLAGVGIAGLAIGFAFQDMAANFIAGIALVLRSDHPFKVGDIVETNDHLGIIEEINLRDTLLQTFSGESIFLPNKLIFENPVINYSLLGRRRVDLSVGISYGDDLQKVKDVTIEAVRGVSGRIENKDIELFFEGYGDSSINFELRFWIPFLKQTDFLKARSEAIMKIKKAYDQNNITIPFPIRTLDFGIKGGQKLSEMSLQTKSTN